jgi:putative cell wall-binding protein
VSGASRFATAAAVADLLPPSDGVFLVEGANPDPNRGWPDAVALSPLAARTATPVLLTTADALPDETASALAALRPATVTVVGGTGAVSQSVAAAAGQAASSGRGSAEVKRGSGPDRFATSAALALETVTSGADPSKVWLTTGRGWPDALAAGPVVAKLGATMLFVDPIDARNSPPVLDWLADRTDPDTVSVTVVGGPGAVSYRASSTLAYGLG